MFRDAMRMVALVAAAMKDASFDVERLSGRAGEGGTTLTELADTLVRDHGLPFRTAHGIAALLLKARIEDPGASLSDALQKASKALLGYQLNYSEPQLRTILSPRHFVDVRRTLGGPAPAETDRAISVSKCALADDRLAWQRRREALTQADTALAGRAREL
jgi:argininosuccinate lyase